MDCVRASAPQLAGLVPYDPKYLPAMAMLSANENPDDVPVEIRGDIEAALRGVSLNRYPDPLANELRDLIAEACGLSRENVLVGNGGDELLFNMALAWGGPGRTFLNMPPTFSVYAANARLTGTNVVDVARLQNYDIDEQAVLDRVSQGDIDFLIVCSPNNPTGNMAREEFILRLLDATDALVVVDEAYCEFSRESVVSHIPNHKNLLVLRTFSKAYSLAGVRMGYVLGSKAVIDELLKVRQPYSVDAVSQEIAKAVYRKRECFAAGINRTIAERSRVAAELDAMPGVQVYPSSANYLLLRIEKTALRDAAHVWQALYDDGVLVRDFSAAPLLAECLRVSIGSPAENDAFLTSLRRAVTEG